MIRLSVHRGTSNANDRGNTEDRRRRKRYLLDTYGDGETVQCSFCPAVLDFAALTVDRITPACKGGAYRRDNIRPACGPCNSRLGGAMSNFRETVVEYRWARAAQEARCEAVTGFGAAERHREEVRAFFGDPSVARGPHAEEPVTFKAWLTGRRGPSLEEMECA